MKISAAMKFIKAIAVRDPISFANYRICGYVCELCGGMGSAHDDVKHSDTCIWMQARELVGTGVDA